MRVLLTALLLVSVSMPAMAQSRSELAAKDAQIEQRLGELEQRYLTGDPAAERLMQRMDSLESSHRALTGEIEQLRYERESLRNDVKALAADLSVMQALAGEMRQHLDAVELASRPSSAPLSSAPMVYGGDSNVSSGSVYSQPVFGAPQTSQSAPSGSLGGTVLDMGELLTIGQQKLLSGDFTGALLAFQQYVDINPGAADIDEAYFWLAETHFVKSGYSDASDAYIASMRAAADGDKAPNAMVGLAASLRSLGNTASACQTLDSFAVQFPAAPSDVREKASIERQRAGCSS